MSLFIRRLSIGSIRVKSDPCLNGFCLASHRKDYNGSLVAGRRRCRSGFPSSRQSSRPTRVPWCDFLACGSATDGVNSFHQSTHANSVTQDVGDHDGEITCQPGGLFCAIWNALTQIWEQGPPDNASKLANALNKTGVHNLANSCTIGAWYLTSAAVGAGGVAAPAAGRLAAQAAADNAPTLVHWGLSKLMGPMMPPGEGVLAGARFYGSLALAGGKWLGNKIGSSVQSGCNALAQ